MKETKSANSNKVENEKLVDEKDNNKKNDGGQKDEYAPVSFFQLYTYATNLDKLFISVAVIFCSIAAIFHTLLSLTFGNATGAIVSYVFISTNSQDQVEIKKAEVIFMSEMITFVIFTCCLGLGLFICTYISTVLFNYSALRQTFKIRELFLSKVLNQDIAWYDVNQTGDFASRVADDLKKIEDGIGEKVSIIIFYKMIFVVCLIQGLSKGWLLTLVCLASFPITTISLAFISWISSKLAKQEMEAYGEAGAIAEETLSSIRTVVAFGGQAKEEERYNKLLRTARNNNIRRSLFNATSSAVMWFFAYASFSLAFWYGVKLILLGRQAPPQDVVYDAGNMITIFFSILNGTWYFGMASPYLETLGMARGAAAKIFGIISRKPVINASKGVGKRPDKIEGNIVFEDVHFSYPSRSKVKILQGLNLKITSGETVALVGGSGCGKSTCIQLIQRFYDPPSGKVYIDDHEITDLDLTWLRNHIGVVGQEPVLFETTIAENIRYGCKTATQKDIERASQKANAHTFITALPQGYETMVGERGAQLSGGQKQRIAIARALVREPAILLLDEATSALDTNSEAVVQAALDAASNECTTVIVAHRLTTVRKADRIVVLSEGKVLEQGKHDDLIAAKGAYYNLVISQTSPDDEEEDDVVEKEIINTKPVAPPRPVTYRQKSSDFGFFKKLSYVLPESEQQVQNTEEADSTSASLWAILKYNSPEWWVIAIGCLSSVVNGASMPVYAIVFGDVLGVLANEDSEYIQKRTNNLAIYFLIIGVCSGISTFLQMYMFGIAGEKLTMRLRSRMFKAILKQEMAWCDHKDNGVGALCARLSGEAASVQGATGQRIGTLLNAMAIIIISLGTSFYFEWRVALVSLCFAPLMIIAVFFENKIMSQEIQGQYKSLQKSTKIAVEAINGIRTVASLGCEQTFLDLYLAEIAPYQQAAKRNTHVRGLVYGISRSLMFFAYSAALYYGATLIKDERLDCIKVFIVSESLITSSWSLGNALAFTPNFQKGLSAASRILNLLNRVPKIVSGSDNTNEKWEQGNINYDKVYFSYPTRPTTPILKGLNLTIMQGKMVALVGPSGCGKSTIIQLLERFYEPSRGFVTVDGKGVEDMNLSALRSHLGIVSQEPNLFSRTIAENIAYGDNGRTVSRDEIIDAAKKANIHNFITSLPLGYDTKLGEKGTQLSGGQKQRVAIARALVRNPKVLLLDEATSALDTESEKVVQEALDNAKVGRTCISIAHRLTTIQDADVICVVNHGRVVEMGKHAELLNLKGLYYNLHSLQNAAS